MMPINIIFGTAWIPGISGLASRTNLAVRISHRMHRRKQAASLS
jgi:hypothetical protein